MSDTRFRDVWDAIEDTPAEAGNMRFRADLMIALREEIKRREWTQSEAAEHLGVTQPRISDLMRGKINLFGIDGLVAMAAQAGLRVEIRIAECA